MKNTNPILAKAQSAYQRGDFKEARKLISEIGKTNKLDKNTETEANQIRTAISSDPVVVVGFGITLFLMIFISLKYLL